MAEQNHGTNSQTRSQLNQTSKAEKPQLYAMAQPTGVVFLAYIPRLNCKFLTSPASALKTSLEVPKDTSQLSHSAFTKHFYMPSVNPHQSQASMVIYLAATVTVKQTILPLPVPPSPCPKRNSASMKFGAIKDRYTNVNHATRPRRL